MKKYCRKSNIIEAKLWDGKYNKDILEYPVNPKICALWDQPYTYHGLMDGDEGGDVICPGDYIVIEYVDFHEGIKGDAYAVKPALFKFTYEEI